MRSQNSPGVRIFIVPTFNWRCRNVIYIAIGAFSLLQFDSPHVWSYFDLQSLVNINKVCMHLLWEHHILDVMSVLDIAVMN